ncbi:glycosyltransferase [Gordonia sp. NPDC058843]|uniref:glycosyltransferase n=1 Tax=Gordonia sp. NPDC058843 TaxID=3346648 RepID=UPI0036A1D816
MYNTDPALLKECINSIRSQQGSEVGDVEIVVHDNSSSQDLFDQFRGAVDVWISSPNVGFAAAANRCVELARHEWILLLNPDARLGDGALHRLASLATRDMAAGDRIYCGWLISGQRVQVDAMMLWISSLSRVVRRAWYRRYLERRSGRDAVEIQKVSGGACFGSRSTLLALGPYDSRFFLYGEDADMSARARHSGIALMAVPGVHVTHSAASSQASHSALVEAARADAAIRLSAYRLGRVGSYLFRFEFLLVTLLGAVLAARTSSKSARTRLKRLLVMRQWGLRMDLPKWDPACLK